MLKSMTGFGKAVVEANHLTVTAEVKSLNSKFTDIYCRIPKTFSSREIEIRNILTQQLERGKIEFNLQVQYTDTTAGTSVNRALVQAYVKDLAETAAIFGSIETTELLKIALTMPNAFNTDAVSEEQSEAEWKVIVQAVNKAVEECNKFRLREGAIVQAKFIEYAQSIGSLLTEVEELDKTRIPGVRERLRKSVSDLLQDENFDKNRFEQELVYYVEKYDISEEKVRLRTHLDYFQTIVKEGNGKKLNFLSQEIGREINTIGSKANDVGIQRLVVNMKDELEKIKEQTSNVL
ncbi:YicC/YloC family endoribonuclease [Cellulophaga sp. BC115SP]|uniref:YicC/YloC family endoribonuclease n=1 Tax=Cellulophaga sp. BC115SP TaxID=2683263 RepID=UPI001411E5DF|nr:YicC/YloC family endoribonuclease [Cellulophaga sp. BC115SP]NBB27869.1 YicC family protein [Cellulophaga sp. BC115SP]